MEVLPQIDAVEWLALIQHELFLFATFFFILGALDELAVDIAYVWLRLRGKIATERVDEADLRARPLSGIAAIFVPAWDEARVIRPMLTHALLAWPQAEAHFYIGCYRNDLATFREAWIVARADARVHLVIHDCDGPTCKADCLNALYAALVADELRSGHRARMVVLHDAEDMVILLRLPRSISRLITPNSSRSPCLPCRKPARVSSVAIIATNSPKRMAR